MSEFGELVKVLKELNKNLEKIIENLDMRKTIIEVLKKWEKGELADLGGEKDRKTKS